MLFEKENVQELLNGLIKIGEVSSVNYETGTARVVFDDDDSVVSYDLQVVHRNTLKNQDYAMPDIGEDVLCVFLASGMEEGFILGSVYAGDIKPPEKSADKRTVVFSDGSMVSFDRSTSTLTVKIGNTTIVADKTRVALEALDEIRNESKEIYTKGSAEVGIESGTAINLNAPTITLTMGATTMKLNGSYATIKASNLVFEGSMSVTGNLSVQGNVSSSGNISASGTVSGSNI